jgi:hypothetical protein
MFFFSSHFCFDAKYLIGLLYLISVTKTMRNTKRYTNQTFTKRVDHEGGARREKKSLSDPSVCEKCGAVYENRHWTAQEFVREHDRFEHWKPKAITICPACQQIEAGVVGGYVTLSGLFLKNHREEIQHLLKNAEKQATEDNPLSRIMKWDEAGDRINIETTTEHLAQRFGHALESAYHGEVKYDFSHENKVARVAWHRDQ